MVQNNNIQLNRLIKVFSRINSTFDYFVHCQIECISFRFSYSYSSCALIRRLLFSYNSFLIIVVVCCRIVVVTYNILSVVFLLKDVFKKEIFVRNWFFFSHSFFNHKRPFMATDGKSNCNEKKKSEFYPEANNQVK